MTDLRVIGIDPGPVPGLVVLDLADRADGDGRWLDKPAELLQCSASLLPDLLETVLVGMAPVLVQVERFVVGRRSGRSSHAAAGARTRDLVGEVEAVVRRCSSTGYEQITDARSVQRSAAAVKPWATDERLEAAGLLEATKGMRHAKDAARHALFAAVHDGGLPDPLSRKASR